MFYIFKWLKNANCIAISKLYSLNLQISCQIIYGVSIHEHIIVTTIEARKTL